MKQKIIILLGVLGISLSSILVKYADAPSTVLAFYRLFFSVILLVPFLLRNCRAELKQLKIRDVLFCFLSGFFLACHFSFYFESIRHTSIASSTVFVDMEVFFVALVSIFIFREKIPGAGKIGILLTFLGSVVLAMTDSQSGSNALYGDILALTGSVFVSVYTLIGSRQRKGMSTTVYTFLVYSMCSITLAVFCLLGGFPLVGYSGKDYLCGLGMAVFCTLMGHSIFSWGLKYASASFISTVKLGEPVFATILAVFLFGQIPGIVKVLGGILVVLGIGMYMWCETLE